MTFTLCLLRTLFVFDPSTDYDLSWNFRNLSLGLSVCVCICTCVLVCRWYRLSSHTHKGPWISIYLFCLFSPSVMWNMLSNNTVWSCNSHNQSVIHISFYIKWKFSHDFLPFSVTLAILLSVFVSSFLLGSVDLMPMKRSVTFSRCFFFFSLALWMRLNLCNGTSCRTEGSHGNISCQRWQDSKFAAVLLKVTSVVLFCFGGSAIRGEGLTPFACILIR